MTSFDRWLDRQLQRLCDALAIGTSTRGGVARLGYAFAGVDHHAHLPVERYDLHRDRESKDSDGWQPLGAGPNAGPGGVHDEPDASALVEMASGGGICSQTQYCNIYGRPCACCGGSDSACPSGANKGWYWSGNCGGRTIWFTDCCASTPQACPSDCPFCKNSPGGQQSWCYNAGPARP
jgi:hypothetical protein